MTDLKVTAEISPVTARRRTTARPRSCVIIVENLAVPFDRRVWQEALALKQAGWAVSVICPVSERHPQHFEKLNDINIYRHPLPLEARGKFAFVFEYGAALFHEFRLLFKVWRRHGFSVIQACNPPDLIFLVVLPFKLLGKRFVFDHHDVCPELYFAKFNRKDLMFRLLSVFEKLTFKMADAVISANDTFRDIAIRRGGKRPSDVTTVYSIPDSNRIKRVSDYRVQNGTLVLGYLGIIGDQDGVDHLVAAVNHLVKDHGVTNFRAVVVGDGPALGSVKAMTKELQLESFITFTGYLSGDDLLKAISSFTIGIIPDPINEYNDKISMNKVFEYSALGIPSVAYPLTETKRLLGPAGTYSTTADPAGLAEASLRLMEDPGLRQRCAAAAADLSAQSFNWETEATKLKSVYNGLLEHA